MWTAPRTWVTGEFVVGSKWNTGWRDNLKETWRRLELINSSGNVSPNTVYGSGNGVTLATFSSFTFTGDPVEIRFSSTLITTPAGIAVHLGVTDGAPGPLPLVYIGQLFPRRCGQWQALFAPTPGSHAFRVAGWVGAAGTGTVTHPFQAMLWQKNGPAMENEFG